MATSFIGDNFPCSPHAPTLLSHGPPAPLECVAVRKRRRGGSLAGRVHGVPVC